jgi:predicted ATPase
MRSPNIIFDKVAITNFKAWKKETFFPLESINLIFGPNSSGKSSLFQALLLLAESKIFTPTFKTHFAPFNQLKLVNKYRDHGTWNDIIYGGRKIVKGKSNPSLVNSETLDYTFRILDIKKLGGFFIDYIERTIPSQGRRSRLRREPLYRKENFSSKNKIDDFLRSLPRNLKHIDVKLRFKSEKLKYIEVYFNKESILIQECEDGLFTKSKIIIKETFWANFFGIKNKDDIRLSSSFFLFQKNHLEEAKKELSSLIAALSEFAKLSATLDKSGFSPFEYKPSPFQIIARAQREYDRLNEEKENGILNLIGDEVEKNTALSWKKSDLFLFEKLKKKPIAYSHLFSILQEIDKDYLSAHGYGAKLLDRVRDTIEELELTQSLMSKYLAGKSNNSKAEKKLKKLALYRFSLQKIRDDIQKVISSQEWQEEHFCLIANYLREYKADSLEGDSKIRLAALKEHKSNLLNKNTTIWAYHNQTLNSLRRDPKFKEKRDVLSNTFSPIFPFNDRLRNLNDVEKSFIPKAKQLSTRVLLLFDTLRRISSVLMSLDNNIGSFNELIDEFQEIDLKSFIKQLDNQTFNIFDDISREDAQEVGNLNRVAFEQLIGVDHLAFYIDAFKNYGSRNLSRERSHLTLTTFLRFLITEVPLFLGSLDWIPPHRQPPKRFIREENTVGASEYSEILKIINNPKRTKLIDDALASLELPYKLKLANKETSSQLLHKEITLLDTNKNAEVSILDVGYGVSQVLPIIFKVFSVSGKVILIEQPELHIHPRLQANLADIFAMSAYFLDNIFMLETHSENLMLRYQRRLKELHSQKLDITLLKKVKDSFSGRIRVQNNNPGWLGELLKKRDFYLSLYAALEEENSKIIPIAVTMNKKRKISEIKIINLNVDGEFTEDWPDGFFDERFVELGLL